MPNVDLVIYLSNFPNLALGLGRGGPSRQVGILGAAMAPAVVVVPVAEAVAAAPAVAVAEAAKQQPSQ